MADNYRVLSLLLSKIIMRAISANIIKIGTVAVIHHQYKHLGGLHRQADDNQNPPQ